MDPAPLIPRRTLVKVLTDARLGAIEAPGGYGKSTLIQLLGEVGSGVDVACSLRSAQGRDAVVAALARSARRVGLAGLGEVLTTPGVSVDDVALAVADRGSALRFVIDEIQLADEVAAAWLVDLTEALPDGSAVLVAGRRLPRPIVEAVRRGVAVHLGEADLRFSDDEVAELIERLTPGLATPSLVGDVVATTGGWPVAVAISAYTVTTDHDRAGSPAAEAGLEHATGPALIRSLTHRLVAGLTVPDRQRLAKLAELPLIDDEAATTVAGPGALDLILDTGLPIMRRPDGWWALSEPVRDVLREGTQLDGESVRAVAGHIARRGRLALAVSLLQRTGDHEAITSLLAARGWRELRELGVVPLESILDAIPDDVLGQAGALLLAAARAGELSDPVRRGRWLDRAATLATASDDAPLARAIAVEQARDAVRRGEFDLAVATATDVAAVTGTGGDESATHARALVCLAHVDTVRATPRDLERAESRLEEAAARFRALGDTEWEADALLRLGYAVSYQGGRVERAIEQLGTCLALLPAPDRSRGNVLSHFAEVLGVAGRADEAMAMAREGLAIGRRIGDAWVIGACSWTAMIVAAHQCDLDATQWWLDQVEASPGAWLDVGAGAEFLLDAAELLASLGDEEHAREYHERGRERTDALGVPEALLPVTARIESTFGDPIRAEEILASLEGSNFAVVRNRWVRRLLRAQAAERRGDPASARLHADDAVRELHRLGDLELLWRTERRLAERLAHLLPDRSSDGPGKWHITMLGRWRVERDGTDCTPPHGHASQLVKQLALRGPTVVDEAIELLWRDVDPVLGRARMRNLLHRLRERTGDVVVRHGDTLSLATGTTVDVEQFERQARDALAASGPGRAGLARTALASFTGELLVSDVYDAWTTTPRERLRRLRLSLVDTVVADALERADLDDALALLDVAIALEPLDEDRYLLAADALARQGRRRRAGHVLAHAIDHLEENGIVPGPRLRRARNELAPTGD